MCRGFSFGLRKPKGLSGQRLAGAAPVGRRAQGEDVSVCVCARVANTKVISPCSFFLSVSGGGGPGGVGGRPGRRLRGRAGAEARSGLWEGSSESLFHIPGVRAREKTVGSTASVSRCRLRERVAPWPETSVQEAGQAGRGRGAEGRLPALERWGRGRGAASSPGHCAPADFHGRLPRSRGRRPGAGHSLRFKRHSRNVNNPGGRASGQERARTAGLGPPPSPGDSGSPRLLCPSLYLPKTFPFSGLQFHLVPPARSRVKGLSHSPGSRSRASRHPTREPWKARRPDLCFDAETSVNVSPGNCSFLGWQC
uniref:Uncharacterized protein n=1 Tax=Mus musculus TaxID=10090 RepID=Q3TEV4_MOUSE|nr:unnamed protein product [Mus musculus]